MPKDRIEELVELSKLTQKMTFEHKLRLMEETARLLGKGRSIKEVLELVDKARGKTR